MNACNAQPIHKELRRLLVERSGVVPIVGIIIAVLIAVKYTNRLLEHLITRPDREADKWS